MQRPVGPSSSLHFSLLTHRHWRGKSRFWIKNKSFCVSHCLWHLSTSRTAAGRSKMGAVLIQLGLRLLLADVQLQEREMDKMGLSWRNRPPQPCCGHRDLLHRSLSDQAVALHGQILFWANGVQLNKERWTHHWCSITHSHSWQWSSVELWI